MISCVESVSNYPMIYLRITHHGGTSLAWRVRVEGRGGLLVVDRFDKQCIFSVDRKV